MSLLVSGESVLSYFDYPIESLDVLLVLLLSLGAAVAHYATLRVRFFSLFFSIGRRCGEPFRMGLGDSRFCDQFLCFFVIPAAIYGATQPPVS